MVEQNERSELQWFVSLTVLPFLVKLVEPASLLSKE
jgi:hypothetical protein